MKTFINEAHPQQFSVSLFFIYTGVRVEKLRSSRYVVQIGNNLEKTLTDWGTPLQQSPKNCPVMGQRSLALNYDQLLAPPAPIKSRPSLKWIWVTNPVMGFSKDWRKIKRMFLLGSWLLCLTHHQFVWQ